MISERNAASGLTGSYRTQREQSTRAASTLPYKSKTLELIYSLLFDCQNPNRFFFVLSTV